MICKVARDLITVITVIPRLQEDKPSTLAVFVQERNDKSLSIVKEKPSSSSGIRNKKPMATSSSMSLSRTSKSTTITNSTHSSSNKTRPSFYEVIFHY